VGVGVEAAPSVGPRRLRDAVAPLPRPQDVRGETGAEGGGADRVLRFGVGVGHVYPMSKACAGYIMDTLLTRASSPSTLGAGPDPGVPQESTWSHHRPCRQQSASTPGP